MSILEDTTLNGVVNTAFGSLQLMENSLNINNQAIDQMIEKLSVINRISGDNVEMPELISYIQAFYQAVVFIKDNLEVSLNEIKKAKSDFSTLYDKGIKEDIDTNELFKYCIDLEKKLNNLDMTSHISGLRQRVIVILELLEENAVSNDIRIHTGMKIEFEELLVYINYIDKTYNIYKTVEETMMYFINSKNDL